MEAESGPREAAVSLGQTSSIRRPIPTALSILNNNFKGLDQPLLTGKKKPEI